MQYQQLDSIQIHQMLAETMYMREVEYRGYEQNLAAFITMIADPTIDPGYKAQVNQWITETKSSMAPRSSLVAGRRVNDMMRKS